MTVRTGLAALLWLVAASPVLAKEYTASRFDSRIEVLSGGSLRITETIVFVFTEGTFKQVFRVIPTRRTDGIEFVSAGMDGAVLPQGEGAGRVQVRRKNGLRVEWNFPPVSASTHSFELTYIARGVVRQTDRADLLEWLALPREHDYRIAASSVEVLAPQAPVSEPEVETRRVNREPSVTVQGGTITVRATEIRRNGSFVISVPLPRDSVLDGPPAWQSREIARGERMPIWVTAATVTMLVGFVLLFGLRQNYDPPPPDLGIQWNSMLPPDQLAPAVAGALVTNGQPRVEHAMAALFSLADRGIIRIREDAKRRLGQRSFVIERMGTSPRLSAHEQAVLDIIFAGSDAAGAAVPLSKARSRFMRHWSGFKDAVQRELTDAHMMDERRRASRRRYLKTGVVLLALAGLALVPCALLIETNGGWPFLIPLAIALVALISFIVMASQTPLSNEGVRRAELWRAFKKHLGEPQAIEPRWGAGGLAEARILPFAVALGLAAAWSKFMKKRNAPTPDWFQAASGLESGHAFAAFVAAGGAGAHGGGAAGGGGVAGGGASGAR